MSGARLVGLSARLLGGPRVRRNVASGVVKYEHLLLMSTPLTLRRVAELRAGGE